MYTTALLTFMAIGGFPSFVEDIKVAFSPIRLNIFMSTSAAHTEFFFPHGRGLTQELVAQFISTSQVFRRERLSGHYGVAEFVISNTLSATPYLAVIAVIPGAMLYYLTGLTKGADRFAYFVVNLCMCTLLVESMMMIKIGRAHV